MAEEQLKYGTYDGMVSQDYWFSRGDTVDLPFTHNLGASTSIKTAQLEIELQASPYTTILSLTLADFPLQWDFTTSNEGIVTVAAGDTATLTPDSYNYDIQLTDLSDRVFTVKGGVLTLRRDVVDNSATSPYPAWDTRADIDATITELLACANASKLVTAIAGGEGTIYVTSNAIFSATDDIRVVLDSGAYEDDTISSVSGSTGLVLSGTIAGAASVGKVVRIK